MVNLYCICNVDGRKLSACSVLGALERLRVYRIELGAPVRIELGVPADEPFIESGFHARESSPAAPVLHWRWTQGPAALRLFAAAKDSSARLIVRTLSGARPPGVAAPEPRFALNGRALVATATLVEELGALRRTVWTIELRDTPLAEGFNRLEIDSATWVPRDATGAQDARTLGVMLESVRLARPER